MDVPIPPIDETTIEGDTPTHRLHLMQMSIRQIQDWITRIQVRRAAVVEKIKKAKSNSSIAREYTVNKQFKRLQDKLDKKLEGVDGDLEDAINDLNKMRALYLEASNGEVYIEKELTNGPA